MGLSPTLRPVLTIEAALEALSDPKRRREHGPARKRLLRATRSLPPGALSEERASALRARGRGLADDGLVATASPPPAVGTTYWLLDTPDRLGLVIRLQMEEVPGASAGAREADFWPMGSPLPEAVEAVRRAWSVGIQWLAEPAIDPPFGWHRLTWADPGDPLELRGRSHTAPLVAMMLSTKLGTPLPTDEAVTGDVRVDGSLHLPRDAREGIRAKHRALARERACVRTLLVPPGFGDVEVDGPPAVVEVANVDALTERLGLRRPKPGQIATMGGVTWRRAVQSAENAAVTRSLSTPVLLDRLRTLHENDPWRHAARAPWAVEHSRVLLLSRLCEHETHAARLDRAADYSAELDRLLKDGRSHGPAATRARNVQSSLAIDLRRYARARALAAEARERARASGDREEEARVLGTAGRVEAHALRFDAALAALDEALALQLEVIPWETNIVRTYRADVLGHLERHDEALAALDEARSASESLDVEDGWRRHNAAFLGYARTKVLLRAGRLEEAYETGRDCEEALRGAGLPSVWPMAGLLSREVEIALELGHAAESERAFERLGALDAPRETRVVALMVARAEASRLARSCERNARPATLDPVRPLLDDCARADEGSAVRDAALGVQAAWESNDLPRLAAALRRMRDAEVY